jgi:hypothetical protein
MVGGREPGQVGGRLLVGEIPAHREAAEQRGRKIGRIVERSESPGGIGFELIEVRLELGRGIPQLGRAGGHEQREGIDLLQPEQPDARLGEG